MAELARGSMSEARNRDPMPGPAPVGFNLKVRNGRAAEAPPVRVQLPQPRSPTASLDVQKMRAPVGRGVLGVSSEV
jgi:hypothetical protein